jgi:hypothetical protein
MQNFLLDPVVMYFTTVASAVVYTALAYQLFPRLFGRRK